MAVTGKFAADFSAFETAVAKADVSLRGMETGAGKVGTSLNKMANALSGTKMIQDATLMAEAVQRVGGVSKLTESELARLSAQAKEAAAKLTAMGQTVPPGIQKIADATKDATKQTTDWKGALTTAAGAFGVAFSVGAVVAFGKSVFDSAGKIHDLASQMGVSTDAVQGFKFAAEQAGSSLDAVGTAITKMNVNLAGGDKATVQALKDAGLSFQAIRNMKPEDAFLAITDAIQKIPDPMKQSDVALQIFGKSAAELLPAIKEGFRGAAEGASKMSEDTINSLEKAGDAWGKLADKVTIVTGTLIAKAMDAAAAVTSSWKGFALYAENILKFGVGPATAMAAALEEATRAGHKNRDINLSLPGPLKQTAEQLAAAAAAAKKYADAFATMFGKFSGKAPTAEMAMLDKVFRQLADSGQITKNQIDAIVKEAIKLQNEGARLTTRLFAVASATDALIPKIVTTAGVTGALGRQFEIIIPKLSALALATQKIAPDKAVVGISNLTTAFAALVAITPETMLRGITDPLKKAADQAERSKDALGALAQAFAQLATIAGGSLGSIMKAFGTVVAAFSQLKAAAVEYDKIANKTFSDTAALAASSALAIIPIFQTLVSVFDNWGAAEERQRKIADTSMREQFNSALALAGSLETLRGRVDALGFSWEKLSQQFTRSASDMAATGTVIGKAIDKVGTAISDFNALWADSPQGMAEASYKTTAQLEAIAKKAKDTYDYMLASGLYSAGELARAFEASAAAQKAAMSDTVVAQQKALDDITAKYANTIGKLESEYKSLSDSIAKEAAEDVMGIVEMQERARRDEIVAEKAAQEAMRDAEIAAKKSTFADILDAGQKVDLELRQLFGKVLEIPYRFVGENVPVGFTGGSSTYTPPAATSRTSQAQAVPVYTTIAVDGIKLIEALTVAAQRNGLVVG